jgi:hypothetical protein
MSNKAVTLVEERSRAKGSNLGVLRAIADYAKDNGRHSFPSIPTLAWKNRLTTRAAELIVRKLVEDGEVAPRWDVEDRRLYLDVRCICDWDAYQVEGPVPEREKISRSVSEKFARSLVETGARRAEKVSSDDRKSAWDDSFREKSPVENSPTPSSGEASPSQPFNNPLDEPCTEPVSTHTRARARGHHHHAFCPPDGKGGFCVPEFLHVELETMLGGYAGEFDLLGWYTATDATRRQAHPTVLDGLRWWRDQLRDEIRRRGWVREAPRGAAGTTCSRSDASARQTAGRSSCSTDRSATTRPARSAGGRRASRVARAPSRITSRGISRHETEDGTPSGLGRRAHR